MALMADALAAQNLVRDPGFEAGAEGWSLPPQLYAVDESVAHTGQRSLRYHNDPGGPYLLAGQALPVQPGKCYRMSVWVRTEGIVSSDTGATICMEWHGPDGYIGGSYPLGLTGTQDWRQISFETMPLPEGVTAGSVVVYGRPGTQGTAWFDDVEVTELPGPLAQVRFAGAPTEQRRLKVFGTGETAEARVEVALSSDRGITPDAYAVQVLANWAGQKREFSTERWTEGVAEVAIPAAALSIGETSLEVRLLERATGRPVTADYLSVERRRLLRLDLVAPNSSGLLGLHGPPETRLGVRVTALPVDALVPRDYTARLSLSRDGTPVGEPVVVPVSDREPALVELPLPDGLRRENYDLNGELLAGSQTVASAWALITVAGPSERPANATWLGPDRMLQVAGKPFFPMGFYILSSFDSVFPADQPYVWLTGRLNPDYYLPVLDRLADSHFNCFIDYGSTMGGIKQARGVLDAAQARGLKAIFSVKDLMPGAYWQAYTQNLPWKDLRTAAHHVVRELRDHPALISWYINDEVFRPDLWEGALNVFRDVRAADPWHPTYAVHYDYKGLGAYREACDVIGTDPYTLCDDIGLAARSWREARDNIGPDQPFWAVVQCFGPGYETSTPSNTREPTYDEERAATMAAIAEGATGVIYYCYHSLQRSPRFEERFAELDRIAAEVQGLVPIISLPDAAQQVVVAEGTLSALTKQGRGRSYVILASTERHDQDVVLSLPSAPRRVRDLTSGETLRNNGHQLALRFRALDARVLELVGKP